MKKEYLILGGIAVLSLVAFATFHVRSKKIEKAYAPKKKDMKNFKDDEIEVQYNKENQ